MKKALRTWVTKGKFYHEQEILQMAKFFEAKGCHVTFDSEKQRSTEQNAYIHAVLYPLITDFFNDMRKEGTRRLIIDDSKDWVQSRGYWGYKQIGKDTIPKRSSEATTTEMVNGIDKLQKHFGKWGLDIPSPNEEDFRIGEEFKPTETL